MRNWDVFAIFEYLTGLICVHLSIIILLGISFCSNDQSSRDFMAIDSDHSQKGREKQELIVFCLVAHVGCLALQIYELVRNISAAKKDDSNESSGSRALLENGQ